MDDSLRVDVSTDPDAFEYAAPTELRPHPRNYRAHPPDQIAHLRASIRRRGFYKNVVTARDGTLLAGHGAVEAAILEGVERVPFRRLDLDPDEPEALSILTGDNEAARFAEINDRALTELLRELNDSPVGLEGTGYDEMMLANLLMVTRHSSEIGDFDAAAEWVGMPEYERADDPLRLVIKFRNERDRQSFLDEFGLRSLTLSHTNSARVYAAWWPAHTETIADTGLRFGQPDE